jgi:hypothetical protein
MKFKKYTIPYDNFNLELNFNDILVLTQNNDINWEWSSNKSFDKFTRTYTKVNCIEFIGDFINHKIKFYLDCNNIYKSYICYIKNNITTPGFVPESLIEGYKFIIFNFRNNLNLTNNFLSFLDDFLWLLHLNINELKLTFVED